MRFRTVVPLTSSFVACPACVCWEEPCLFIFLEGAAVYRFSAAVWKWKSLFSNGSFMLADNGIRLPLTFLSNGKHEQSTHFPARLICFAEVIAKPL